MHELLFVPSAILASVLPVRAAYCTAEWGLRGPDLRSHHPPLACTHSSGNSLCFCLQVRMLMCVFTYLCAFSGLIQTIVFFFFPPKYPSFPLCGCVSPFIISASTSSSGDSEDCSCPYDNLSATVNHQGCLILTGLYSIRAASSVLTGVQMARHTTIYTMSYVYIVYSCIMTQ